MPELRVELPADTINVMDGYCSATGKCRTELTKEILGAWAEQKHREAIVICRVAGSNPTTAESGRR